jgi:hypothetical protein
VGFQGVGTVFEVVGGGDGLSGELFRFAGQDEAFFGAVGQGGAEDEAAGFGREYSVVGYAFGGFGEGVHGRMEGVAVFYEGGYVLKGDALPREVGDGVDMSL